MLVAAPDVNIYDYKALGTKGICINYKKLNSQDHIDFFKSYFNVQESTLEELFNRELWSSARPRWFEYVVNRLYKLKCQNVSDYGTDFWFHVFVQESVNLLCQNEILPEIEEAIQAFPGTKDLYMLSNMISSSQGIRGIS